MRNLLTIILAAFAVTAFAQVQVTFQVDMSNETVSADGVHIAGNLNGWSTDANMLTDQGNGIYAITLDLEPGKDYEYKYLNGNVWGTEEAAPGTCTIGGNNRIFTAPTSDMTITVVPFNACSAIVETQMVKFSVDMTGQTVSADGIHVAGNFQAWDPGATAMTDAGNNIYEVTIPVLSSIGIIQYKFVNGNAWGSEETPGAGCGNGDNNRPYIIKDAGSTVDLPVATFGGCANPVPTKTVVFNVNLAGATPSIDGIHLAGSFQGWDPAGTMMTDLGNDVYQVVVDVMETMPYIEYKYVNGNAWGAEETVPAACNYNTNRFEIIELSYTDTTFTPLYEFGTCTDLSVSTNGLQQVTSISIAPTIANESVLVTWETSVTEKANLIAYDLNGRVVFQQNINNLMANDNIRIDVNNWSSGMYIIQLRTANRQYSQKIIVE
ncbi:MAG: T9SS type A sorting domain-containing protein [Saprospiraceae bacterium]